MYPITSSVKALFDAEENQVLRITGTDRNGNAIMITDANVLIDGFNIDRYSCNGTKLEIGTAISSELTLKLNNQSGEYNDIVFEGTELFVEIGIADWSVEPVNIHWMPCGYYTPDEQPRTRDTITIHALDRMIAFDAIPPTLTPWTTDTGEIMRTRSGEIIYFAAELEFPCTVKELVEQVCLRCSVPLGMNISNLPNANYQITDAPRLQQTTTFRKFVQWCAGMMASNAWVDWNGNLQFTWYGASTGYVTTVANRFNSDLYEDDITITGVQYTNTQNVTIVSGTSEYALDMTGNYLAQTGIDTILPRVNQVVNGFTYRPFTATVINAPYLWPMDIITFTGKDGNNHSCAVTNVNFGINSTTSLGGKGETARDNSLSGIDDMTKQQAFIWQQAVERTNELDESLNQEGIFNRLTNNGETQGLLMYDGKVYLNASYINTGTMTANRINGGVLTLGGRNNTNGLLNIVNAYGEVIGTWGENGIEVNKGSINADVINGGTLTLGGNNNRSGVLRIVDADDNVIGTWSNNGVQIQKGYININDGKFVVDENGNMSARDATLNGTFTANVQYPPEEDDPANFDTFTVRFGENGMRFYKNNVLSCSIEFSYEMWTQFISSGTVSFPYIGIRTYGGTGLVIGGSGDDDAGIVIAPNGQIMSLRMGVELGYTGNITDGGGYTYQVENGRIIGLA